MVIIIYVENSGCVNANLVNYCGVTRTLMSVTALGADIHRFLSSLVDDLV